MHAGAYQFNIETAAQHALSADRFARCARFAAAEARAVSRLTHCNQGAVSYACLPYPAQNRTS